ncbi:MAG: LexA family transcriptional regulator [Candidatus Delongbacteria bacterium]|nr:LexA family transcriptional regulator [Candidatus Delongbacteria bacterium]
MSILADNIRFLRGQLKLTQQKVADALLISRGRYSKYEDSAADPPIDILLKISKYFNVSIDLLISVDIKKYPLDTVMNLPGNKIVIPVAVDSSGDNKIEIIPHKASMGYLNGYGDPEYIENLQTISLPFLRNGKFRAFPAEGDSMPPYNDGTFIVGKFVEHPDLMTKNRTYIFVTRSEGVTYKRYIDRTAAGLWLSADNSFYKPYEIKLTDIYEIWEFACAINTEEFLLNNLDTTNLKDVLDNLQKDIQKLRKQLD